MSYSGRSIRHFVEQELGTLPHFIIYAVLEWTLIALLFIDGFLAFVSVEFAEFFDLQPPCVLCTRVDHILARHKKSRYCYNETICDGHKKDLSSLAYCHVHRKLSDIRTMCKGCLLSFATDNNTNKSECTETYNNNLYNGGRNKDLELLFDDEMKARLQLQPQYWNEDNGNNGKLSYCSCCGEAMKVKPKTGGFQKGSPRNISSNSGFLSRVPSRLSQQAPAPSPRAPFGSWRPEEGRVKLELPHIRCREFKSSETTTPREDDSFYNLSFSTGKDETKPSTTPMPTEPDELMEDRFSRTISFGRSNRFSGISDSAAASPRFSNRMPRKSLLDKIELGYDPVEAITGNETDTEVIITRLKKQVRLDRKSLIALYMELDEERSASAIAANNAMAMITRLQAEKASVQMEALQYQRMMEEQAEYDKEDIQMLKDFLNKKEDEFRDLESELDLYRDRYGLPNVTRDEGLEKSQSFNSISEHGSPLFGVNNVTDTEMDLQEHASEKSSSGSMYEEGEYSGEQKNDDDDDKEDDISVLLHEEGDYIEIQNDDEFYTDDGESGKNGILLGRLKFPGVEDTLYISTDR